MSGLRPLASNLIGKKSIAIQFYYFCFGNGMLFMYVVNQTIFYVEKTYWEGGGAFNTIQKS